MQSGQRQTMLQSEFILTLNVGLQYFIQHGYHVIMLNFGASSHFSFIDCMFCDTSMFTERCNKNNKNINVLFIVCVAITDHYHVKILDNFQTQIRIPIVCKWNSNRNSNSFNIPNIHYFASVHCVP